jgi:hypothetical protein
MQAERTVSRFTFGMAVLVSVTAMSCIEVILLKKEFSEYFGRGNDVVFGLVGGLLFANMVLANQLADRAFKAMGLSRSGRTVEARLPASIPPEDAGTEEIVEIKSARSTWNTLA